MTLKRLDRLKAFGGLKRLPSLAGDRRRKQKVRLPELRQPDRVQFTSDTERWIASVYGDARLAGRIMELKEEFPSGYIPELVVYDWLRYNHIEFAYQVQLFGGRQRAGGLVPDFLLLGSHVGKVLQIHGMYWHSSPTKQAQDQAAKLKMIGSRWRGIRITSVTNIYERDLRIAGIRERVIRDAVNGIEMPA